jgi:hypothetical protein
VKHQFRVPGEHLEVGVGVKYGELLPDGHGRRQSFNRRTVSPLLRQRQ